MNLFIGNLRKILQCFFYDFSCSIYKHNFTILKKRNSKCGYISANDYVK